MSAELGPVERLPERLGLVVEHAGPGRLAVGPVGAGFATGDVEDGGLGVGGVADAAEVASGGGRYDENHGECFRVLNAGCRKEKACASSARSRCLELEASWWIIDRERLAWLLERWWGIYR